MLAALVLVALYVTGPEPHVQLTDATVVQPGVLACVFETQEVASDLTPIGDNCFLGTTFVPGARPMMTGNIAKPQAARRRFALYLVGLTWRVFDVDLSRGRWLGFGTDATYP